MPIYEYECSECGVRFEKLQHFGDPNPDTCPRGHKEVHRLLSQPTIIFKGSGFYVTDNRDNGRSGSKGRNGRDKATPTKDKDSTPATTATTKAKAEAGSKSNTSSTDAD